MPARKKPQKPTVPIRGLTRGPASCIRPLIVMGTNERPGGRVEWDAPAGTVRGSILAVWSDGVTLRRMDTGTEQFLYRGDYRVLNPKG